ncbi:MAG: dUTP diphosphatase [Anaerosolibacter sp.]|jgi:dUTP pyrophosphatase|uniref:dUTP diphosphatase n=1 Tax=Anaerosolibacter sp. TaxID=1872527 RepID=UPI002605E724|nr:dUTP diphosphatase [Anaerosolibacter sp.]MDF2545893.1 dUTP diphosphatase [Anaerosolibacter sp.]
MIQIKIKLKESGITLPTYETSSASGMDLRACLSEEVVLGPCERSLIPTGIHIELPEGLEAQVRARSGLAIKHGIGLINGIGTIDSDYRGEIKVPLINWGKEDFIIQNGERIAQLVICRYERIDWVPVEDLNETARGLGGFGHTGK